MTWVDNLNERVNGSRVGKYFDMAGRGTNLSTEVRAGLVTFLTTCYILAVNSAIIADSGGPCSDADCTGEDRGPGCRFTDAGFQQCVQETRRSLTAATAATALLSTALMGLVANMPLAVAPGMGINAYFAYTVVGFYGTGKLTYAQALAAVFVEGWIFLFISLVGIRGKLVSAVPKCIMLATAGGIGLFLAHIGLQKSQGIGLVTYDPATLVTLGGCPPENRVSMYSIANSTAEAICVMDPKTNMLRADLGPPAPNYQCKGKRMHSTTLWMGICAFACMAILMAKRVKGSVMVGIVLITAISWIPGHSGSYLGATSQIPGGEGRLEFFKNVVAVPNAQKTTLVWSFSAFGSSELWLALITFLYLDFLDTTGTLYSMASMINQKIPGFIDDKTKGFPRQIACYSMDGIAVIIGSLFGLAPLTVYIESASGIREGGRTGVTALVTAFGFLVSLFFTPLIVSIPPYATGPALVLVGAMMLENLVDIDWADVRQAIPAFLTVALMPLTYSIAYGVLAGICSYIILWVSLFTIDVVGMPFTKRPFSDVWQEHCPDLFADRYKRPAPLKSPSAILQQHVNPEHAAHAAAVANSGTSYGKEDPDVYGDDQSKLPVAK